MKAFVRFTTIFHDIRKHFGLSLEAYIVADVVYTLQNSKKSKIPGWYYGSRDYMASEMGISRRSIINHINDLIDKKLLERDEETNYLRTTDLWDEIYIDFKDAQGVQNLHTPPVQNFHAGGASFSQPGCANFSHNNNIIDNNSNTIVNTTDVVLTPLPEKPKKTRAKSSKVAARQEKAASLYSDFIDAYYIFYKERHDNVPPRIDGGSGNAAKSLIAHFKTVARTKHPDLLEENIDGTVIEMIEFIFFNWQSVRPFLRDQYDLKQISANINNIMADIKKTPPDQRRTKDAADAYVYFKNYFNGK